jgi:hypothetical protein
VHGLGLGDEPLDDLAICLAASGRASRVAGEMLNEVTSLLRDPVRITEVGKTILLRVQHL